MAEFNYSDYVAKKAQRKGPMHETDNTYNNDVNQLDNSYLDQLDLTTKIYESETIYEYGSDGNCYRIDDEGNRDVVSDSYCQRYAGQGVRENEMEEAIDDTDVEVTDDEFSSDNFDKEPSKKDIKAAEKEFSFSVPKADDSVADSALEKAKQIIKIKVGKILSQPKGQRSKSTDLVVLRQFIQRPDIKKAFKARGLDVMDFVKDVIA